MEATTLLTKRCCSKNDTILKLAIDYYGIEDSGRRAAKSNRVSNDARDVFISSLNTAGQFTVQQTNTLFSLPLTSLWDCLKKTTFNGEVCAALVGEARRN